MIKFQTFFTVKIWIPDIFCFLETLGETKSSLPLDGFGLDLDRFWLEFDNKLTGLILLCQFQLSPVQTGFLKNFKRMYVGGGRKVCDCFDTMFAGPLIFGCVYVCIK